MNEVQNKKAPYVPPTLELFEYAVEHGFANTNLNIPRVYNNEEVSEITDRNGENYHGEWF